MTDFVRFGDPARFELAIRWVKDSEPRGRRPAAHGWSMGDLQISVGGVTLTRSAYRGRTQSHVGWYLAPLIDWIATNWAHLLHEEDFAWREPTGLPASVACRTALKAWIDVDDEKGRLMYRDVQSWYCRHGLRAAAEGGLLPDLFIRRLVNDVELSWNAAPPVFAPEGFTFVAEPAHASFAVDDVAGPLWSALGWFADTPPAGLDREDQARWATTVAKIDAVRHLSIERLQAPYLTREIADILSQKRSNFGERADTFDSLPSSRAPAISEFAPAVAMFGGVSPNLSRSDATKLLALLAAATGEDCPELAELTLRRGLSPLPIPHQDGYDFATDLLEDMYLPGDLDWIDVRNLVAHLGIAIASEEFESNEIRGVALAGNGMSPKIVLNDRSVYNRSEEGCRFTIAHELCHILHDRSRARRVTHVSGPWVAQGFERRANAFAAYLLMPRPLVLKHLEQGKDETLDNAVRRMSRTLRVSESALVEHMFNIRLISDPEREQLRPLFNPTRQ